MNSAEVKLESKISELLGRHESYSKLPKMNVNKAEGYFVPTCLTTGKMEDFYNPKKAVIYWDIENIGSNVGVNGEVIVKNLKSLADDVRIIVYGNKEWEKKMLTLDVEYNVAESKKELADKLIINRIFMDFIKNRCDDIFLITNDADFRETCLDVCSLGVNVCLIHSKDVIMHYAGYVTKSFNYYELLEITDVASNVTWKSMIIPAMEKLVFGDKIKLSDKSIRAAMRMDNAPVVFEMITTTAYYAEQLERYMALQETMDSFGQIHNWMDVPMGKILSFHRILLKMCNEKFKGKYPLAKVMNNHDQELSIGLCLSMIELAIKKKMWLTFMDNKLCIVSVEAKLDFARLMPDYEPKDITIKRISAAHSKSALQHFMQKTRKCLPKYDLVKTGEDHEPKFTAYVKVYYCSDNDNYFMVSATSTGKKSAEAEAAKLAVEQLFSRRPDFEFPNDLD